MPKIFISYRRADSQTFTDRIYDRLATAFGEDNVFQDVDSIRAGADFRVVLKDAVESCDVVLVMIGQLWAKVTDAQGQKRLFNTADFVRIEVESALNSQKVVIPVLIEGAAMPNPDELPPSLHELLYRNAAKIRHNPDFNRDMLRLIEQIKLHEEELTQRRTEQVTEHQHQTEIDTKAKADAEEAEDSVRWLEELGQQRAELPLIKRKPKQGESTEAKQAQPSVVRPQQPQRPIPASKAVQDENFVSAQAVWQRWRNPAIGLVIGVLAVGIGIFLIPLVTKPPLTTPIPTNTSTQLPKPTDTAVVIPTVIIPTVVIPTRELPILITHNVDWKPIEQDFNGVTMVQVPAGCFDMGNDPQADDVDTKGVGNGGHICFDNAFWLDKTEVTNAQFTQFGGKAANPSSWTDANRPRETITWIAALDFCVLRGGRLPTEAEWEYAARGPDNLIYPWGNEFVGDNVVYSANSNNQTADVGGKLNGVSWVGAMNLSDNVGEWVSTLYKPYPYPTPGSNAEVQLWIASNDTTNSRVLRGGSWFNLFTDDLRASGRTRDFPDFQGDGVGFRCARSS